MDNPLTEFNRFVTDFIEMCALAAPEMERVTHEINAAFSSLPQNPALIEYLQTIEAQPARPIIESE